VEIYLLVGKSMYDIFKDILPMMSCGSTLDVSIDFTLRD
jgi:hypothetical protein